MPPFAVISGGQVQGVLEGREKEVVGLVAATYRLHGGWGFGESAVVFSAVPGSPVCPDYRVAGLDWWAGPGGWCEVGFEFPGECGGWGAEGVGGVDFE